ncbi:MAG: hypothetical protein COV91_03070, partial [Candidatus Taylorbacteria bacterium CG11_big_fil_rev_8_21_14_0_20_46_11]
MNIQTKILVRPETNDPPSMAVHNALTQMGYEGIQSVRLGKFVDIQLRARTEITPPSSAHCISDSSRFSIAEPLVVPLV